MIILSLVVSWTIIRGLQSDKLRIANLLIKEAIEYRLRELESNSDNDFGKIKKNRIVLKPVLGEKRQ